MDFNTRQYKRSRGAYMAQCTVEYFVTLLVTDAFLAKLLTHIGISDYLVGIISSFISMAFVIQLAAIFLVRINVSTKKIVMFFDTISIFFFMLLYLIPFVSLQNGAKTVLVVLSVLLAYLGKYLIYSLCFKWANSFVNPENIARYSANKEIISLITGMIFTAVIGYIIDYYEGIGNLEGGFLFIAVAIFFLNICNFICLLLIKKEDEKEHTADNEPFFVVLKETLGNKNFRNIIILTVLFDVARYFSLGFIGVFKTKELLMSVFLIQIVNIIANGCRVLVSKPIAKYSDKTSYAKGFRLGLCLAAVASIMLIFTTKATWWLIIIYTIFYSCSVAGTNQNSFNISYSYVDSKYISQAMAIKNSIGGICGFGASVLGGKILEVVQEKGNTIFGLHIYGQQVLGGISLFILIGTIIFMNKVIVKQTVMKQ